MLARDQRTPFSDWWWTVDKLLLGAIMALMLGGVILSLAASPPVATRIRLNSEIEPNPVAARGTRRQRVVGAAQHQHHDRAEQQLIHGPPPVPKTVCVGHGRAWAVPKWAG